MFQRMRLIPLVAVVVLTIITLSYHVDSSPRSTPLSRALLESTGAAQESVGSLAEALENIWTGYFYLVDLKEENRRLQKEVDVLRGRIVGLQEQRQANLRLLRLLHFATDRPFPYLGAQVISRNPAPWYQSLVIDRGTSDGLAVGMPVVSERGVVGRVVEVSSSYAKVLLLTDYSSSIPAMIQKNRLEGVLSGRSNDTLSLKYVEKTDDVASGDVVVTSGGDGVFPKGLPLGTISRVEKPGHDLHLVIDVMPMARFEHLEEVLVILTKPHPFVSQRVNPEGSGGDAG